MFNICNGLKVHDFKNVYRQILNSFQSFYSSSKTKVKLIKNSKKKCWKHITSSIVSSDIVNQNYEIILIEISYSFWFQRHKTNIYLKVYMKKIHHITSQRNKNLFVKIDIQNRKLDIIFFHNLLKTYWNKRICFSNSFEISHQHQHWNLIELKGHWGQDFALFVLYSMKVCFISNFCM